MKTLFYIRQKRRTIKTIRLEYGKLGIGFVLRLFEGEVNKNINKEDLPQEEMFESEQQLLKIIYQSKKEFNQNGWILKKSPNVTQTSFLQKDNMDGRLSSDY